MKFTLEVEAEGKIPFLDLCINQTNNKLSSTWYCKPTDTGLIMNYHASAPNFYKNSVLKCFVHWVYRACSSWENFHDSMDKVKIILQQNQYPQNFYAPIISNTIEKVVSPKVNQKYQKEDATSQKNNVMKQNVFIEYRGIASERFIKRLKSIGAPLQPVIILR